MYWRLGGLLNQEIDFGFGCGCDACVRACEAVRAREGIDSFGARPAKSRFVGCRGRRPGGRRRGSTEIAKN